MVPSEPIAGVRMIRAMIGAIRRVDPLLAAVGVDRVQHHILAANINSAVNADRRCGWRGYGDTSWDSHFRPPLELSAYRLPDQVLK